MTVAEFYQAHAVDGRAYVEGSAAHPRTWLTRVDGPTAGAVCYCVCHALRPGIRIVPPHTPIEDVALDADQRPSWRRLPMGAARDSFP